MGTRILGRFPSIGLDAERGWLLVEVIVTPKFQALNECQPIFDSYVSHFPMEGEASTKSL
jgi:hypothetical protein